MLIGTDTKDEVYDPVAGSLWGQVFQSGCQFIALSYIAQWFIGTTDFYYFIPLSLALAVGHKAKRNLLA